MQPNRNPNQVWVYPTDLYKRHNHAKLVIWGRWPLDWSRVALVGVTGLLFAYVIANLITIVQGAWTLGSFLYSPIIGGFLAWMAWEPMYKKVDHQHPVRFYLWAWSRGIVAPRRPGVGRRVTILRRHVDPKAATDWTYGVNR